MVGGTGVIDRVDWPVTRVEFAVLISGITSMGMEILAGRIIAPSYGSSIFTWGSIIGVFLAALSLGYWLGGKRASENATTGRLAWLLVASAAYVAVILYLRQGILLIGLNLDIPARYAPLIPVTVLFGPPTYFLGFISPYGAELSRKVDVGEASGHVYALGTIGSIAGAFATTFYLVPTYSIDVVGLAFGFLLLLSALVVAHDAVSWRSGLKAVGVSVLLISAGVTTPAFSYVSGEVVHQEQTQYQRITVAEEGDVRTMYSNGHPQSTMDMSDPKRYVHSYTRYFLMPWLMTDEPGQIDRVLVIGGGGFTGSRQIAWRTNATVDAVEIDPGVIRNARKYFNLTDTERLNVINAPGRRYLRETNRTYDLIILDAFKKDQMPFQLTTEEFFRLASDRLSEHGFLYVNGIGTLDGQSSQMYRAQVRTLERVYPQVYVFPVTYGENVVTNIQLIAAKDPDRVSQSTLAEHNRRRNVDINLSEEITHYETDVETGDVPVLRDDHAPVDQLTSPLIGRRLDVEQHEATG
ncbi:spermidine synthase [Halobacteriales archaeon QS_1_68_17]|nr:MAG: spermidine synthase [Halobacteriales archaeon QS_1_68_17]